MVFACGVSTFCNLGYVAIIPGTRMARFPLNTVVNFRSCGSCQACCTVLGVQELEKPHWTRCHHQCATGCAIYEDRPRTCRGYSCLWAAGLLEGDDQNRPDRLGIILDLRTDESDSVKPGDKVMIQVWEVWPRALDQPDVAGLVRRIAEKCLVVVRRYGSDVAVAQRSILPSHQLTPVRIELAARICLTLDEGLDPRT